MIGLLLASFINVAILEQPLVKQLHVCTQQSSSDVSESHEESLAILWLL